MALEFLEAFAEAEVVVERQGAGVGIESEGAEGAGQPRHLDEQFLGMAVLGDHLVAQRRQRGIDGVQQPEVGDVAGGELASGTAGGAAADGGGFLVEDLDEALHHGHQGSCWR